MAAFTYDAINAQGFELSGEIYAPDLSSAREQLRSRGLLPQRRVQEGEGEVAAGVLAPARDDDRGRRQRGRSARDARRADGRQVPRRRDRRCPRRGRGRNGALDGARATPQGV